MSNAWPISAAAAALAFAVIASCGGDSGPQGPSVRVTIEADLSDLPPDVSADDAIEGIVRIIDKRMDAFDVRNSDITREAGGRLTVEMSAVSQDAARQIVQSGRIRFREPVLNARGQVACTTDHGTEFFVTPQEVTEGVSATGTKEAQCFDTAGVTGTVVWIPATGKDSSGQTRRMTGALIKPNGAKVDAVPSPVVTIEFTSEGSLLFEQITTRLVGYPLGMFLDDKLLGAPTVRQPITGTSTVISGLSPDEAENLAKLLNAGAMPIPVRVISVDEVQ